MGPPCGQEVEDQVDDEDYVGNCVKDKQIEAELRLLPCKGALLQLPVHVHEAELQRNHNRDVEAPKKYDQVPEQKKPPPPLLFGFPFWWSTPGQVGVQ